MSSLRFTEEDFRTFTICVPPCPISKDIVSQSAFQTKNYVSPCGIWGIVR